MKKKIVHIDHKHRLKIVKTRRVLPFQVWHNNTCISQRKQLSDAIIDFNNKVNELNGVKDG